MASVTVQLHLPGDVNRRGDDDTKEKTLTEWGNFQQMGDEKGAEHDAGYHAANKAARKRTGVFARAYFPGAGVTTPPGPRMFLMAFQQGLVDARDEGYRLTAGYARYDFRGCPW